MKKNTLALIALCSAVFSAGLSAASLPERSTLTLNLDSTKISIKYLKFFNKAEVLGKAPNGDSGQLLDVSEDGLPAGINNFVFDVYGEEIPSGQPAGRKPQKTSFDYTADSISNTIASTGGKIGLGGAIVFGSSLGKAVSGDFRMVQKNDGDSLTWVLGNNIQQRNKGVYLLTVTSTVVNGDDFTLEGTVKYDNLDAADFLGGTINDDDEIVGDVGTFKFTTELPPITVPNVVGKTQAAATADIKALGLSVDVTEEFDLTVPSGDVISQFPLAGYESDSITPLSEVNLVVSKGPAPVNTPNVVNQTEAAAIAAFNSAGFTATPTVTPQAHPTIAVGLVISQTPAASASVAPSTAVALVVSTGPVPVDVPNVVGEMQAGATATLTGAGLTVGTVTKVVSNTIAAGVVISQTPVVATSVAPSSAVNLVVSSGFDGNNDNTPDSTQDDVAEVATGAEAITLDVSASGCTTLDSAVVSIAPSDSMASPVTDAIDFKLSGCGATANIDVYFYGLTKTPTKIRKYGKTAASAGADVWYDMAGTITAVTVNGLDAYKASYTVTDNGLGDNDPAAGVIADPVMLAAPLAPAGAVKPIPTLSFWGLLALSALMPGMVSFMSRRKSRK